jgi:uncharacterized protein YebE (UPF0316 family)
MFTQGQLYFAVFFVIAFTVVMLYTYRKDITMHRMHYKKSYHVMIAFVIFILALFAIKFFLKK